MLRQLTIYLTIFILVFSLQAPTRGLTKIQVDDTWQYEDDNGNIFNETNLENFIKGQNGYSRINTTRPFSFDYYDFSTTFNGHGNIDNASITVSLNQKEQSGNLFVTQTGGVPVYHSYQLNGVVNTSVYVNNTLYFAEREISVSPSFDIDGAIENGLSSATPTNFDVIQSMQHDTLNRTKWTYSMIMSSFEQNNYTVQYEAMKFEFYQSTTNQIDQFGVEYYAMQDVWTIGITENESTIVQYNGLKESTNLELNQENNQFAYKITLDDNLTVPKIIEQSEPVKIESGISFNQINDFETVVYNLVPNTIVDVDNKPTTPTHTTQETDTPIALLGIGLGIATLVLAKPRKIRK